MATNFVDTSDFTGRALLVEGIGSVHSQMQTADKITIHFQKKSNRGGDVTKVLYPLDSNRDAAIVVFDDAEQRESALLHRHVFHEVSLRVQRLPPIFRSVEVEIDPVYVKLLPNIVHGLMRSQGSSRTSSLGRQNSHKMSFSSFSELRYAEEEVYNAIARQSETSTFSSTASGFSSPEQVDPEVLICRPTTERDNPSAEERNFEDEVGQEGNRYQSEDGGPEVFHGQRKTERDNPSAAHAACDMKIEENETSTTDVAMKGQQTSGNADDGSATETDHTVILDMFSFSFLKKFEKAAIEKILKKYKVRWVQKECNFSVKVTFLPYKSKPSTIEIQKAVDEFTTLYRTTHGTLSRKTVDCPSVISVDLLEKAASKTSKCYQNDVFIERLPGSPVRYVFLSTVDVEEVVKYFKKLADIKSSKKLKTPSSKDTKTASPDSTGSQFGHTQVGRESCFPSTISYSSALIGPSSSPPQSTGVLGDVHFVTNEGIHICIRKGDITMQRVEAIVSPCQQNLRKTAGAAMAIEKAAGFQLKSWCLDYLQKNNFYQVDVMKCLISPGFNLCPTIIHAIGPYSSYNIQNFMKELYHTFLNCLCTANLHKITSMAMPLIGSGMTAGPKKDCADALVEAVFDFSCQGNKTKDLRDIYLVNIDGEASEAIKLSFEAKFQTPVTNRSVPAATKAGDDVPDAAHRMSEESARLSDIQNAQNGLKEMAAAPSKGGSDQFKSDKASGTKSSTMSSETSSAGDKTADDSCPICLTDVNKDTPVRVLSCKHWFCETCIKEHLRSSYRCPICRAVCCQPKGNQPKGTMKEQTEYYDLPGFKGVGSITITYDLPGGKQLDGHPNPGKPYFGATRTAYLPNNPEGREVVSLLRKAFDAGLVFTIGRSITTGTEDTVTWTSIHHKTSRSGGPSNYGYPDAGYLKRVKEDLASLGIK
ncbi:uncharacterized protein LOC117294908 [Asterias rubens]|uniref:uncharacterized protein LOC117294908 n=1 Tax=Asterias rubens TaxID=7604 RepID=UPI00145540A2|nr:uncharacterized protein LOC117294908 [Asterias rubens]XP_033633349.1 uncharacterized protein LOC117294908 [Asterias rubens]